MKKTFIRSTLVAAIILGSTSVVEANDSCAAIYQVSQDLLEKNSGLNNRIVSLENQSRSSGLDKAYYESKMLELQKALEVKEGQIDLLNSSHKHTEEQLVLAKKTLKRLSINIAVLKNISQMEGDINSILEDSQPIPSAQIETSQVTTKKSHSEQEPNDYQSLNALIREKNSSLSESTPTQVAQPPADKPEKENDYTSLLQNEIATDSNKGALPSKDSVLFSGKFTKDGLPIRVSPLNGARIIGLSQFNKKISIVEKKGSWYRLSRGGWVHKSIVNK